MSPIRVKIIFLMIFVVTINVYIVDIKVVDDNVLLLNIVSNITVNV